FRIAEDSSFIGFPYNEIWQEIGFRRGVYEDLFAIFHFVFSSSLAVVNLSSKLLNVTLNVVPWGVFLDLISPLNTFHGMLCSGKLYSLSLKHLLPSQVERHHRTNCSTCRLQFVSLLQNEAPRSKLRGITELNSEDFSEGEANPVASYGECQVHPEFRRCGKTAR